MDKKDSQVTGRKRKTFSFPVKVAHVGANPVSVKLEANETERQALAERWSVLQVDAFTAQLDILRWKRDGVRIKGSVSASIAQSCVVTLEPVEQIIDETLEALFVPEGSKLARIPMDENGEMVINAEGPDIPETFAGDSIDVAKVCEEFVVLAIDPYPRKENAVVKMPDEAEMQEEKARSPFADLEKLKKFE